MNLKEKIKESGIGWYALPLVVILIVVMVSVGIITHKNNPSCEIFKEKGIKLVHKYLEDKLGSARRNTIEIVKVDSIEKGRKEDFIRCTLIYSMKKDFDNSNTTYTMSHTATADRLDNNEGWLLSFSKYYKFSEL